MDTPFDPNNWQTQVNKTQRFMKIAAGDVMDGVELLPNMFSFDMKRIPGFVDAGGTSVGATYCGKSVCCPDQLCAHVHLSCDDACAE